MAKVYFQKTNFNNFVFDKNGQRIAFTQLGQGHGVAEFDEESDAGIIATLREFIKKKSGGITEITSEQSEELKKKLPFNPYEGQRQTLRVHDLGNPWDQAAPPQPREAQSVPLATVLDGVATAALSGPAQPAAAQGSIADGEGSPVNSVGRGRKIAIGKPKPSDAPPVEPQS